MNLIKNEQEIDKIRESSTIVKIVKDNLKKMIKPGVSLNSLDIKANELILEHKAQPSFLGYNGFPSSICTSVNDTLIHGIPTDYILKEGDIISVDVGAYKNGYHGDSAFTLAVGKISQIDKNLIKASEDCLKLAIEKIRDGIKLGEVGDVIERCAKLNNFYLVKEFAGHGVGKTLHEEPFVFNFKKSKYSNFELKSGMVIAIEPMLLIGSDKVYIDPIDNWSIRSIKATNTAHCEHTVLVTDDGAEILT